MEDRNDFDNLPESMLNTKQYFDSSMLFEEFPKDVDYIGNFIHMWGIIPLWRIAEQANIGSSFVATQGQWEKIAEAVRLEVVKREMVEELENTIVEDNKEIDELKKKIQELLQDDNIERARAWERVCEELTNLIPGWISLSNTGTASACTAIRRLAEENTRLKNGQFSDEELQNLCHNLTPEDKIAFCNGCDKEQNKLFGSCRTDEIIKEMEIRFIYLERRLNALEANAHVEINPFIGTSFEGQ